MVWGEERPVRSSFPVVEVLTLCALIALAGLLVSDPIGRAAAKSYKAAAQTFIETRDPGLSVVSRNNVDVKDLALQAAFLNPDPTVVTKVDFGSYQSEGFPDLDTRHLDVAARIQLAAPPAPVTRNEPSPEPLVVEAMDGTFKQLLDNEDDTLLDVSRECSRSDELIGLCGGLTLDKLIEEDASSR